MGEHMARLAMFFEGYRGAHHPPAGHTQLSRVEGLQYTQHHSVIVAAEVSCPTSSCCETLLRSRTNREQD